MGKLAQYIKSRDIQSYKNTNIYPENYEGFKFTLIDPKKASVVEDNSKEIVVFIEQRREVHRFGLLSFVKTYLQNFDDNIKKKALESIVDLCKEELAFKKAD